MKHISSNNKILLRTILKTHGCINTVIWIAIAKLNSNSIAVAKQARHEIAEMIYRLTGKPITWVIVNPCSRYFAQ
jgi:hypothetical protein